MELSKVVRVISQTWGYDKAIRLGAYGSKVLIPIAQRLQGGSVGGEEKPLAASLNALSRQLANYRVITRLSGILSTIDAIRLPPSPDPVLRRCDALMNWSMLVYFPLEHLAWLCDIGVIRGRDSTPLWKHSCRLWLLYLLADVFASIHSIRSVSQSMVQLAREISRTRSNGSSSSSTTTSTPPTTTAGGASKSTPSSGTELQEQQRRLREYSFKRQALLLHLINSICDIFLAYHWSFPLSTPLSETAIGWFGVIGTLAGGYLRWAQTS